MSFWSETRFYWVSLSFKLDLWESNPIFSSKGTSYFSFGFLNEISLFCWFDNFYFCFSNFSKLPSESILSLFIISIFSVNMLFLFHSCSYSVGSIFLISYCYWNLNSSRSLSFFSSFFISRSIFLSSSISHLVFFFSFLHNFLYRKMPTQQNIITPKTQPTKNKIS